MLNLLIVGIICILLYIIIKLDKLKEDSEN